VPLELISASSELAVLESTLVGINAATAMGKRRPSCDPISRSYNMFSKSVRTAFVALTALAVSTSATQSLSVKLTGVFQVSLHS